MNKVLAVMAFSLSLLCSCRAHSERPFPFRDAALYADIVAAYDGIRSDSTRDLRIITVDGLLWRASDEKNCSTRHEFKVPPFYKIKHSFFGRDSINDYELTDSDSEFPYREYYTPQFRGTMADMQSRDKGHDYYAMVCGTGMYTAVTFYLHEPLVLTLWTKDSDVGDILKKINVMATCAMLANDYRPDSIIYRLNHKVLKGKDIKKLYKLRKPDLRRIRNYMDVETNTFMIDIATRDSI